MARTYSIGLAILAACGSPRVIAPVAVAPTAVAAPAPHADLATAHDMVVSFYSLDGDKLVEIDREPLPDTIIALEWVGAVPVVMLADQQIGRVAPFGGYTAYPFVPDAMWDMTPPRADSQPLEPPIVGLDVDVFGTVWQARCDFGLGHLRDGIDCDKWHYARLSAGTPAIVEIEPRLPEARPLPADIAPSPTVRVETFRETHGNDVLSCTFGGATIMWPPIEDRDDLGHYAYEGVDDPIWIATDPPVFYVTEHTYSGDLGSVFEGCTRSTMGPAFTVGPDQLVALGNYTSQAIFHRGRALGTIEAASFAAFSPAYKRPVSASTRNTTRMMPSGDQPAAP